MSEVHTVAVVGAGTMGSGIAHVFARSGFQVTLCDVDQRFLDRALTSIRTNLGREAAKGKLPESEIESTLGRIRTTVDPEQMAAAEIALEAAPERFELKSEVFRALDRILPEHAILATNTSSISITKMAALTRRPCQVIGMHFFNPVPVMTLVEVVRGMATSDATFAAVRDLSVRLGKTPVEVNDAPGFVSNRVLMPLINEAAFAIMEGVATAEAVDQVFKLGMAHPMGPLTLADFIGIDVCVDILRVLQEGFGDPKYRPCPLLVRMVDAGWLGRKTGHGFYVYEKQL
ncbi:MAG: 3-hydroxybutyryl-CoA dehydrogenase [Terracidiphilus sp.]